MSETVTLTTEELRRLIREEVKKAMEGMATLEDVDARIRIALNDRPDLRTIHQIVQAEIDQAYDRTVTPILDEVRKMTSGLVDIKQTLATLVENSRNTGEAVRDVKDKQKRQDIEQGDIKRELGELKSVQTEIKGELDSQKRAVFGDVTRPGTKSLFDHISDLGESLAVEMGKGFREIQIARELDRQEISRIQLTTEAIVADVEANKQFRERRQRIEQTIVQSIPKAGKRILDAAKDDFVIKWAMRIGIGGGLAIIAALLERLQ